MLNIILGKYEKINSEKIYHMAYKKYLNGISGYVFVPSQSRILVEKEYIEANNLNGIIGVNITSFGRYISQNLEETPYIKDKKYLSDMAKKLVVKKEINKNDELFKIFRKVKEKPSFIDSVISYFEVVKKEEVNFNEIFKNKKISLFLKSKLEEFAQIYEKVKEKVDNRFIDSVDEIDIYINNLIQLDENKDKDLEKQEIYFCGYNNFEKKELKAISNMLKKGYNVTIAITMDDKYIESDKEILFETYDISGIFYQSYKTYEKLLEIAKNQKIKANIENLNVVGDIIPEENKLEIMEDIKYLGKNIFRENKEKYNKKVENVSLNIYKNIYEEIESIAKEIYFGVYKSGYRFNDYAIYTNDFINYENAIKKTFEEYNIPIYFDIGTRVKNDNIVIYLKGMLDLVKELPKKIDPIIDILKTGLILDDIDDIVYFENYTKEFGIKGYFIGNPFQANNKKGYNKVYDLEKINKIRSDIYSRIVDFKEKLKKAKTSIDFTREIYNHIVENNIEEIYLEMNKNIAIKDQYIESISTQMIKKIYEAMDNICLVNKDEEILIQEYIEDFSFLIEDIVIKAIPSYIDQVLILDINKSRTRFVKNVYIIGAYENGLPGLNVEDNIFKDNELDELKAIGVNLKENSVARENMALFNIFTAINNAKEKLKFTMPASKITGEAYLPSYIIEEIKEILNIKVIGDVSDLDITSKQNKEIGKYSKDVSFKNMLSKIVSVDKLTTGEIKDIYNTYLYFLENKESKYRKILEYKREDKNLSKETLNKIYKENINSSVSKMERFSSCPFSYLSNYVLNLKENKEYKVTSMDVGNILHEAIDGFSMILVSKNLKWQEIINLEKEEKFVTINVENIVKEMFKEFYSKFTNSGKYIILKEKINKSLIKIILGIADSFNNSVFKPLGYEIKFGKGEIFSPIEIKLENGHTMLLTGKIDRVDSAKIGNDTYLRVVDYKSKDKTLKIDNIKEGLSLQLMAYMSALLDNKEKIDKEGEVIPASISYLTITSKLINIKEYEKDENKIKKEIIKLLKNKGIYINDIKILSLLDKNFNNSNISYIDISNTVRSLNNINKSLNKEIFIKECKDVKETLKKIGEEITEGVVKISPKKLNGFSPCEYCSYKTVCRKSIRG